MFNPISYGTCTSNINGFQEVSFTKETTLFSKLFNLQRDYTFEEETTKPATGGFKTEYYEIDKEGVRKGKVTSPKMFSLILRIERAIKCQDSLCR